MNGVGGAVGGEIVQGMGRGIWLRGGGLWWRVEVAGAAWDGVAGEFVAEADKRPLEQVVAEGGAEESEGPVEVVVGSPADCF
jgi:hypothetical protein